MKLYNTRHKDEIIDFETACFRGLASDGGLYMPCELPKFNAAQVKELLAENFVPRSIKIAQELFKDVFTHAEIANIIQKAFSFSVPMVKVGDFQVAELFHGPTLAFKDFGGGLMAQILAKLLQKKPQQKLTILAATSGDTGAAIAHAFYHVPNIQVVVLYPAGMVSPLQEKLFSTLGDNIHTLKVQGSFDDCQALVKQAFLDAAVSKELGLTSANSINIARLLAQVFYYFEACAQTGSDQNVICVPSGNFGNLTAGLFAQKMGAPIKRFVVATNANDTVPLFFQSGEYRPKPSVATLSNAMDVGAPNNFERVRALYQDNLNAMRQNISAESFSDAQTIGVMKRVYQDFGYVLDPHTAVAFGVLEKHISADEVGIVMSTAHPAKFQESVEAALGILVALPQALAEVADKKVLSHSMENDYAAFKGFLQTNLI